MNKNWVIEILDDTIRNVYKWPDYMKSFLDYGFHKDETIGEVNKERMAIFCANLHGEVSELWEATRKDTLNKLCDKTNDMTNAEEELADIVIRAFDSAVTLGISIGTAIKKKS
jgi:NTP pyrophosphatase (non-canonical NTP hydrolase)